MPLCETISRLTAAESRNFGIHVDEFYGTPSDSPAVLSAARSAQVILYEGHVSYQEVIDEPILKRIQGEYYPWEEDEAEESAGVSEAAAGGNPPAAPRVLAADPIAGHLQGPLEGCPLSSCKVANRLTTPCFGGWTSWAASLDRQHDPHPQRLRQRLLNAAMSSLLYRGGTLGEALCDAENYMFCVEELKARRGHKEMAKGVRVALSFPALGEIPSCKSCRWPWAVRGRPPCGLNGSPTMPSASICPPRGSRRSATTSTRPTSFPTARWQGC